MTKILALIVTLAALSSGAVLNVRLNGTNSAKADGVTDDTFALQSALNSTNAVFFPAGRYLTGGLKARSNTDISAASNWTAILLARPNIKDNLISAADMALGTVVSNVTISDLKLLGQSANQNGGTNAPNSSTMFHGISMRGTSNWIVDRVWAQDFDGDGIYMGRNYAKGNAPAMRCTVIRSVMQGNIRNGCMMSDARECVWLWNTVRSNQVGMNPASPKYFPDYYNSAEMDIEPNRISTTPTNTVWEEIRDCLVASNTFAFGYTRGIQIAKADAPVTGNRLVGNLFVDNKAGALSLFCLGAVSNVIEANVSIITQPSTAGHFRITGPSSIRLDSNRFSGGIQISGNNARPIVIDSASWTNAMTNISLAGNLFDFSNVTMGDAASVFVGKTVTATLTNNQLIGAKFDVRGTIAP